MRNDGFIVVEIENDKIVSVDGMFTNDYIRSILREKHIAIEYYCWDYRIKLYVGEVRVPIKLEEVKLPLNVEITTPEGEEFQIETLEQVTDEELSKYYQEKLEKFKNSIY
ncbi:MAG: hypothetical protein V8R82_07485 [Clostridia bacterium]